MAARYGFLDDTVLCGADIFRGIEDLLRCRDVIVCARQQIGGQVILCRSSFRPRPMNSPLARRFSLKIWLITWRYQRPGRSIGFRTSSRRSLLREVCRVVDVLIEIDMILNVVLLGVQFSSLQHELALHQAPPSATSSS